MAKSSKVVFWMCLFFGKQGRQILHPYKSDSIRKEEYKSNVKKKKKKKKKQANMKTLVLCMHLYLSMNTSKRISFVVPCLQSAILFLYIHYNVTMLFSFFGRSKLFRL